MTYNPSQIRLGYVHRLKTGRHYLLSQALMIVHDIMTTRIVTISMDDPLSTAKEIFEKIGFHHLLVLRAEKLESVLSATQKYLQPRYFNSETATNFLPVRRESRFNELFLNSRNHLYHRMNLRA